MGVLFPTTSGHNDIGHDDVAVGGLIVFEIVSVVLQLVSLVFNGAIICTLCRRSLLKYPSNRFVFSLCLSHLTVSFLSVTISLVSTFLPSSPTLSTYKGGYYVSKNGAGSPPDSFVGKETAEGFPTPVHCSTNGVDLAHLIMMHLNFGVAVCTSITVALISAERYITIARPMRYKSIVTARRSMYAIICCWLLAALITMMPLLLFENRHPVCGTFSVPMESLATYFGIVFAVVTLFALAVMIVCYTHIFRIAKAKCQKVQIGHFTASTVSSISSDWPSSVYSSAQGQNRFLHAGSRIESSNSLLHWVLLTNLGRHAQPRSVPHALRGGVPRAPPATPTLPPKNAFFSESALNSRRESDETTATGTSGGTARNGSTSSSNSGHGGGPTNSSNYFIDPSRSPLFQYHPAQRKLRNRWKTYLQPNYNSPRKTIFTIVLLIGAVLFTQLPLSFVLFTSTVDATQKWFQFCTTVLFSTSSVANPVLYGFLNRSIRDQLWRLLKRKSRAGGDHGPSASSFRKRKRGQQQQLEEIAQNPILSPANHSHLKSVCRMEGAVRSGREIPAIKISRKASISSDDDSSVHSVASSNSVNIIGTAAPLPPGGGSSVKARPNQVQKRFSSTSYYRTVLLKKANSISKSNSLLPRLALPDVNVRRSSSGSIISINTNGVTSSEKGKVKEVDEEWASSSAVINNYDDNDDGGGVANTGRKDQHVMVEMKTFRNYSTPDLPLSLSSSNNEKLESEPIGNSNEEKIHNSVGGKDLDRDDIELSPENRVDGQVQLPPDNGDGKVEEKQDDNGDNVITSCPTNSTVIGSLPPSTIPLQSTSQDSNPQPAPSQIVTVNEKELTKGKGNSQTGNLEACLSAERLTGGVIDGESMPDNFPRKPSQDSGADMSFSDEEDEPPPLPTPIPVLNAYDCHHGQPHHCHHHHHSNHQPSPVLLSAASLTSLPGGTVAMILKTGEDMSVNDGSAHSSVSSLSLGPLFTTGYPDADDNGTPTGIIFLPCSCTPTLEGAVDPSEGDNCGINGTSTPQQQVDTGIPLKTNNVTVTITDSNSDTQLFNPELFSSNRSLLHVDSCLHGHRVKCFAKPHKSKSESDICTANHERGGEDVTDLKIRSNCHINSLIVDSNTKANLSCNDHHQHNNANNPTFTLVSNCKNCSNCHIGLDTNDSRSTHNHISRPLSCCAVWVSGNGQLPLTLSNGQVASGVNLASPQWLSVMSIHSSCSSLSSSCPLRILDGHNKSDISDYDDFEDNGVDMDCEG